MNACIDKITIRLKSWWREPATKTDYIISVAFIFAVVSAITLWR